MNNKVHCKQKDISPHSFHPYNKNTFQSHKMRRETKIKQTTGIPANSVIFALGFTVPG